MVLTSLTVHSAFSAKVAASQVLEGLETDKKSLYACVTTARPSLLASPTPSNTSSPSCGCRCHRRTPPDP